MKLRAGTSARLCAAAVVDLADARDGRRLRDLHLRLGASLDRNRGALARLFQSGLVFTRAGSRLGRELLLAHQHLLRAGDLLARLPDAGAKEAEALLERQVRSVLDRTDAVYARSGCVLAREP